MDILHSLKGVQLKEICLNCGTAVSGTKKTLVDGLGYAVRKNRMQKTHILHRSTPKTVLSIDMGLRNLAVCLLEFPTYTGPDTRVNVLDWRMHELDADTDDSALYSQPRFAKEAMDLFLRMVPEIKNSGTKNSETKNPWPDAIVVEKQRFNSTMTLGAGRVPESIVRLNIQEGMILALLQDRNRRENTSAIIESVGPRNVVAFWQHCGGSTPSGARKVAPDLDPIGRANSMYKSGKQEKVALVTNWLKKGTVLNRTAAVDLQFENVTWKAKKRDDLSDSLLQGLAWINWYRNLGLLSEGISNQLTPIEIHQSIQNNVIGHRV